MDYLEFVFITDLAEEYQVDLLIHALGEAGFDSFEPTSNGFNAYVQSAVFDDGAFNHVVSSIGEMFSFSWQKNVVQQKNWNEVWESNFEPLVIKAQCFVRATFHQPNPEFPLEIIIDPKMSFGTGHHQTTTMMMEFILEENMLNKSVLDMGAGTGILAILASKLGATDITAIDYDPVCYESMFENAQLNNANLQVLSGSAEAIPERHFDIIFANINRNILLQQFERYVEALTPGGELYISGFYEDDASILIEKASSLNLSFVRQKTLENWCSVKFLKQT